MAIKTTSLILSGWLMKNWISKCAFFDIEDDKYRLLVN